LSELRTGFEFGYADRVKANVKIKLWRDASNSSATAPPLADPLFGDDGVAVRVIAVLDDVTANLEESSLAGATAAEQDARVVLQPPFSPSQPVWSSYNIIKEFPGEIQVFIDDMDRYAFQVAVEDRDMAKVLDGDGNAYLGLTASSGSRGFALLGYDPVEIQETHDLLAWNFCTRCVSRAACDAARSRACARRRGNTAVKGSRDHVAIYLEAADSASAPHGWKRFVDFRLGVVAQPLARPPCAHAAEADAPQAEAGAGSEDKSIWRSGSHEFNSETSDGTWGFSQVRLFFFSFLCLV
jgi:hypothetical protein